MNKTKPSAYSFQSADPFLDELLARREADAKAAASYAPKPKAPNEQQPQPKPPGFARTTPPPTEATKPAAPAALAAPAASSDSSSSGWDLRRVATKDAYEAEQDAFSQREGQGFMVDPLSRKRSGERFRNTMAGIDAEQRIAERNERLRQRTRDMVAENKARREARTAGTQANAARAPAAGPSNTARPQSTQTGAPVKGSGSYIGVPEGYDLTFDQLARTGDDTLYGTSPDGRKFLLNQGEQPTYLDGQPRPPSVARRPQEPAAPFVYQDPRRLTNETPEGRLRNAGVLTPTGGLNLEATDYGRQQALKDERARTDALYQKLLADDIAKNPSNDPGLRDSSRRDPIGSARRSLRQTPQRQLMDLADFMPPPRRGFR